MATSALSAPEIGEGAYTVPEAARILHLYSSTRNSLFPPPSLRQVRAWLRGGRTFGLRHTDYGIDVVAFSDLISLEVVHRLNRYLSIYRIRHLENEIIARFPGLLAPFASQVFFTDGAALWMRYDEHAIEVQGKRRDHLVLKPALESFATQIFFDDRGTARRWYPSEWIELDPTVQFGAPVARGSRVTVATIESNLTVGTPTEVADWYGLPVEQVEGIATYFAAA